MHDGRVIQGKGIKVPDSENLPLQLKVLNYSKIIFLKNQLQSLEAIIYDNILTLPWLFQPTDATLPKMKKGHPHSRYTFSLCNMPIWLVKCTATGRIVFKDGADI